MHEEKRINMGNRIAQNVIIKSVKKFWNEEDGMGVVEIVLITVVLIGLVIIFKSQITSLVNKLLSKMTSQANKI
jgi:Flp pilus assembly pilin Flp